MLKLTKTGKVPTLFNNLKEMYCGSLVPTQLSTLNSKLPKLCLREITVIIDKQVGDTSHKYTFMRRPIFIKH